MSYITIDDVTRGENRVCFYFGFNDSKISFAAKKLINGHLSEIRSDCYNEVIAWIGFNELSKALYSSVKFKKKYRLKLISVLPSSLLVGTVNLSPVFYFKCAITNQWKFTQQIEDLTSVFGENIESTIISSVGRDFIEMYNEFVSEKKGEQSAYASYLEHKNSISTIKDIAKAS